MPDLGGKTYHTIQHAKPAVEHDFINFHIKENAWTQFHKYDLFNTYPNERKKHQPNYKSPRCWKAEIVKNPKKQRFRSQLRVKKNVEQNEKRDSFSYFKTKEKLSLKQKEFFLIEYIEE